MSHRQTPERPKLGPLLSRNLHPLHHLIQDYYTDLWSWHCDDCGYRSPTNLQHPAQGTRDYIAHVKAKHPEIL
jgi:hypothetical protein